MRNLLYRIGAWCIAKSAQPDDVQAQVEQIIYRRFASGLTYYWLVPIAAQEILAVTALRRQRARPE